MKKIALVSVYTYDSNVVGHNYNHLYELLKERKPEESISHKAMPSLEDHYKFIEKRPYHCWYLIQDLEDYKIVGAIYLTRDREIGISIYDKYRCKGYASEAIKALMEAHPQPKFVAHINPVNFKSEELFLKLGFKFRNYLRAFVDEKGRDNILFTHDENNIFDKENAIQKTFIFIPGDEA